MSNFIHLKCTTALGYVNKNKGRCASMAAALILIGAGIAGVVYNYNSQDLGAFLIVAGLLLALKYTTINKNIDITKEKCKAFVVELPDIFAKITVALTIMAILSQSDWPVLAKFSLLIVSRALFLFVSQLNKLSNVDKKEDPKEYANVVKSLIQSVTHFVCVFSCITALYSYVEFDPMLAPVCIAAMTFCGLCFSSFLFALCDTFGITELIFGKNSNTVMLNDLSISKMVIGAGLEGVGALMGYTVVGSMIDTNFPNPGVAGTVVKNMIADGTSSGFKLSLLIIERLLEMNKNGNKSTNHNYSFIPS